MKKYLFLFLCLFWASLAQAANTYYFSTAGSGTPEPNNQAKPYYTLAQYNTLASGTLQTGDSVLLNKGETWKWTGVFIPISGVNYGTYGTGAKPKIFSGNTAISSWDSGPDGNGVYIKDMSGLTASKVFEDGYNIGKPDSGPTIPTANYYWYFNSGTKVLYYKPTSGVAGDHTVTASTSGTAYYGIGVNNQYLDGWEFVGCDVFVGRSSNVFISNVDINEGGSLHCNNTGYSGYTNLNFSNINMNYSGFDYQTIMFELPDAYISNVSFRNMVILYPNATRFGGQYRDNAHDNDAFYLQNIVNLFYCL